MKPWQPWHVCTYPLTFYCCGVTVKCTVLCLFHSGLDLTEYSQNPDDPEPVYNLFAVSNHFGGMGGGHCKSHPFWWNGRPCLSSSETVDASSSYFTVHVHSFALVNPLLLWHTVHQLPPTDTAYCKNKDTGKWYNYDDSHVSETSESHLVVSQTLLYCVQLLPMWIKCTAVWVSPCCHAIPESITSYLPFLMAWVTMSKATNTCSVSSKEYG